MATQMLCSDGATFAGIVLIQLRPRRWRLSVWLSFESRGRKMRAEGEHSGYVLHDKACTYRPFTSLPHSGFFFISSDRWLRLIRRYPSRATADCDDLRAAGIDY